MRSEKPDPALTANQFYELGTYAGRYEAAALINAMDANPDDNFQVWKSKAIALVLGNGKEG